MIVKMLFWKTYWFRTFNSKTWFQDQSEEVLGKETDKSDSTSVIAVTRTDLIARRENVQIDALRYYIGAYEKLKIWISENCTKATKKIKKVITKENSGFVKNLLTDIIQWLLFVLWLYTGQSGFIMLNFSSSTIAIVHK